jgi:DNA-binding transcriptional LysR family regulator
MKLAQMRHFVGLAAELHFGRAADRLGIAQPPLSQSIRRLESSLGLKLINRGPGGITLTPAGEVFAREARIALRQVALVERATRRAASNREVEIRIGFVEPALFRVLPALLSSFRQDAGSTKLALIEMDSLAQIDALARGELDLGIFVGGGSTATEGISARLVESSPLVACVPDAPPFAGRTSIKLGELASHTFIMLPPAVFPIIHEAILFACRRAGFVPRIEQQTLHQLTTLSLVVAGHGIAFVPDSARFSRMTGLSFLPVDDLPDLRRELFIGWRTETASSSITRIADLVMPSTIDR